MLRISLVIRWSIKGKVQNKSQPNPFSNYKGQGKSFKFELVEDDGSSKISNVCFNELCDQFFFVIENTFVSIATATSKTISILIFIIK
jgi:hypothetical protein